MLRFWICDRADGRALRPTPQENLLFVEQASCLLVRAGSPAHPTREFTLCGTGILPVQRERCNISAKKV
ncbi:MULTISPECIES: hypothetical protein [unclassified Microcoleus]|uniref:hypothetical protein n=1 Tax=unclassified Microcoleus TaxID=2642155 RepID=UPI001D72A67C|nr:MULTISPECIES: hypothetical protein [unclassified Microcoleus]MCC3564181.1 hypothetical protein [Microcoleus sp. PH2017_31_RDM_U_A]MCC3576652.1 hypothetical protein [Microcoleus sp. PH2017_32_RDM_D_A]MCC3614544.1 hypothetical protein [Microcoleus sp. PH2017_38_RDM_U_B]TAF58130.1 MAG: hypothetical protein EAZ59_29060 [Oscillatoriales cyanobacterium]